MAYSRNKVDELTKVRIILLGEAKTGKSIIRLVLTGEVVDNNLQYQPTIGIEFNTINTSRYKIQCWDSAGAECYRFLQKGYVRGSHVALFVINPMDFEENKKVFVECKATLENNNHQPCGKLIIFTHADLWANDQAVKDKINAFKAEFLIDGEDNTVIIDSYNFNKDELLNKIIESYEKLYVKKDENTVVDKNTMSVADRKQDILSKLSALKTKNQSRFFKPDASRADTIYALENALRCATDSQQIINAMVEAIKDMRTPLASGAKKYGVNIIPGFMHFSSIKNSKLYQLIEKELAVLAPDIKVADIKGNLPEQYQRPRKMSLV